MSPGSLDLEGAGAKGVLPSVPFLSLSLFVDWDREQDVQTCELLLCMLTWEVSKSMDSSVEESLLLVFPCPDWFGSALAASLAWASSIALGDIRVTVTCGSKGFFLVVEEELGAEVVAVVVVATAVETARLDVVTVVMVEGRAPVLPGTARGMTVFSSGLTKAWNPSVVPIGKSLVPGIPPIPSLVEDGNAGNAA